MQGHDQKEQDTAKLNRRKFLTRAGAGLVIASLPAKSVWAGSNGLAGSIIASGHGSDFAGGKPLVLKSSGFFGNSGGGSKASSGFGITSNYFCNIFPGNPLPTIAPEDLQKENKFLETLTMRDILQTDNLKFHGDGKVNRFMAATYMNAIFHGQFGIYFPVIGSSPTFQTPQDLAEYLYLNGLNNGELFGLELQELFAAYAV